MFDINLQSNATGFDIDLDSTTSPSPSVSPSLSPSVSQSPSFSPSSSISPSVSPSQDPYNLLDACIAQWHFNESSWNGTSGEVVDTVGGNNGTALGGATTALSGKLNRCGQFSTGRSVSVPVSNFLGLASTAYSIEVWIYDDTAYASLGTFHRIVSWYDNNKNLQFGLGTGNSNPNRMFYLTYGSANALAMTSGNINTGWNHAVVTYNGSSYVMYVNGVLRSQDSYTRNDISLFNTGSSLYIGQRGDNNAYVLGYLDEVRIFDRALMADEVLSLYNNGSGTEDLYGGGMSPSPSSSISASISPSPGPEEETHSHLKKVIINTPVIVAEGGTGLASITDKGVLVGAGTSNVAAVSPGALGNVLKSDGTNWISGEIDLVTDGSITYEKLASDLVDIVSISGTDIDWSLGAIYTKSLTTNTTFTFSNYQLDKIIILKITGQYALGFPINVKIITGEYDGTVMNYITLHCTNSTSGSEEVWGVINQRALSDYDNSSQSPSVSPSVSPSPSP